MTPKAKAATVKVTGKTKFYAGWAFGVAVVAYIQETAFPFAVNALVFTAVILVASRIANHAEPEREEAP